MNFLQVLISCRWKCFHIHLKICADIMKAWKCNFWDEFGDDFEDDNIWNMITISEMMSEIALWRWIQRWIRRLFWRSSPNFSPNLSPKLHFPDFVHSQFITNIELSKNSHVRQMLGDYHLPNMWLRFDQHISQVLTNPQSLQRKAGILNWVEAQAQLSFNSAAMPLCVFFPSFTQSVLLRLN